MPDSPTSSPADTEAHRFPCNTCGADMRFDPSAGVLTCDHCGARETLDTSHATEPRELDYAHAINTQSLAPQTDDSSIETRVSECPNCGARTEFDPDLHAMECPFCATPVVADTGTHRSLKPRGLLPFALTESAAHDAMNDWLGRLWFAPNGLRDYARKGRKLDGMYIPYWTFDAQTESDYRGARGTDYYVTRRVKDSKGQTKTVRQRRTRWRPVSGRVSRFFDDVLVLASNSLPRKYTAGLEPWDLSELEPYLPDYLAGFRAEAYTVKLEDGFALARAKMDRVIQRDVKFDIGGDRQRIHDIHTDIRDVTFKHILLPVWVAAYKYRGKSYRFIVNGRTGRVQGERPYSAWKIAFAVIAGVLIAGAIGYFAANAQ